MNLISSYRFTTYQDARRVRLVDGLIFLTNILRVSPVKSRRSNEVVARTQLQNIKALLALWRGPELVVDSAMGN